MKKKTRDVKGDFDWERAALDPLPMELKKTIASWAFDIIWCTAWDRNGVPLGLPLAYAAEQGFVWRETKHGREPVTDTTMPYEELIGGEWFRRFDCEWADWLDGESRLKKAPWLVEWEREHGRRNEGRA